MQSQMRRTCQAQGGRTPTPGLVLPPPTRRRFACRAWQQPAGARPEAMQQCEHELGVFSRREAIGIATLASALSVLLPAGQCRASLVDEDIASRVYATCSSSTVSVILYKRDKTGIDVSVGVGSGFLFDSYGHIVTNYHVISRLDKSVDVVKVKFLSGADGSASMMDAKLVASDTMNDIAVLQVEPSALSGFQAAPLGTSADLKVGQSVYAIGAPYGLSGTLSAGVVSGVNRSIPSPVGTRIYGVIQTDASINAGNSGGPLLDSSGRVVGVNTATFTKSGTGRGSGINFALPIDSVRDIVPKLVVYGNSMGKRV